MPITAAGSPYPTGPSARAAIELNAKLEAWNTAVPATTIAPPVSRRVAAVVRIARASTALAPEPPPPVDRRFRSCAP